MPPKALEHKFWPTKIFFHKKIFPHICVVKMISDVGIILSHVCWGRPPPPPLARQVAQPQPKPPSRHGDQGGGGGGWANGLPYHPPPAKQFSSRPVGKVFDLQKNGDNGTTKKGFLVPSILASFLQNGRKE